MANNKKVKKEEKIKEIKIGDKKVIEGYLIYDKQDGNYLDDNGYLCDDEEDILPCVYNDFEDIKEMFEENLDYPEKYEIHEVEITYNIKNILVRKVVYESV